MSKAESHFRYFIHTDGTMVIEDLDLGGRSVTNDIENVLHDIIHIHMPHASYGLGLVQERKTLPKKIIYRDSDGIYDGIHALPDGEFVSFYTIGTRHLETALRCAKGEIAA